MKTIKYINYGCYFLIAISIIISAWSRNGMGIYYNSVILLLMYLWHSELYKDKTTNIYSPKVNVDIKIDKEDQ